MATAGSSRVALATEGSATFGSVSDSVLAYAFQYPTSTDSGSPLSLTFSRRPEKYSSAAPLTADARQRIVCELVDLARAFTVSVSVGPPSGVLVGKSPSEWRARDVADAVLIDRSTARITTGQRVALNSIERVSGEEVDGATYIYYEHTSQGSPNLLSPGAKETYRHAKSVTTVRPGQDGTPYLYTFNITCPEELWEQLEGAAEQAVRSFRLTPTTRDYCPPDKDPWNFIGI